MEINEINIQQLLYLVLWNYDDQFYIVIYMIR